MTKRINVGSHVKFSSDYIAEHGYHLASIHEVVDYNRNWGFRVMPVEADSSGRRVRDCSKLRWVDPDNLELVAA